MIRCCLLEGDLHDGNGLSDATKPDGVLSNKIFEEVDYDVLTIGKTQPLLSDGQLLMSL